MNIPLPRQDVLLPNEHERKQIFYWLKQVSSWTAWNRILGYYKAWADAAEQSVRAADNAGILEKSTILYDDYVYILKGLAHCEEGVRRLRKGDKRVFQYNAHGEFAMAGRAPDYWHAGIWGRGEMGIDYERTPHWEEFECTLKKFNAASGECSVDILESDDLDAAAPFSYGPWIHEWKSKIWFPDSLSDVPNPTDDVLVRTGKPIPCSGIWEPVDAPKPKGFSLFKQPPPRGPFPIIGCMNYLHGGSPAPRATQRTADSEELHHVDVTWRLLWRDDRYEDGSIPEEERDYRFLQPGPINPPQPTPLTTKQSEVLAGVPSGQPCPRTGYWLTPARADSRRHFERGELMPDLRSDYGATIWQWDSRQAD
ncbi:Imm71 family immunity protein [Pseudorhodoferax sp.]|uniref:Imm71 family immunity protein n=1 Tax=Pseudorhodoferax sp. TaxID=1993553 RepID=UPI0039E61DA3